MKGGSKDNKAGAMKQCLSFSKKFKMGMEHQRKGAVVSKKVTKRKDEAITFISLFKKS